MRTALIIFLAGLCAASTGCTLAHNATRNVCSEIWRCVEDSREEKRNKAMAREAWALHCTQDNFSGDYAKGFRDGFVEFLDGGGVEPPSVPPRHYWTVNYQNPQGYQAIEDWYAGYRHGAGTAMRDSDNRKWIVVPHPRSAYSSGPPMPGQILTPPEVIVPDESLPLPMPRELPPSPKSVSAPRNPSKLSASKLPVPTTPVSRSSSGAQKVAPNTAQPNAIQPNATPRNVAPPSLAPPKVLPPVASSDPPASIPSPRRVEPQRPAQLGLPELTPDDTLPPPFPLDEK